MNNQNLTPQLPSGTGTLIERYKPTFDDVDLNRCITHPDHDTIYGNPDEGVAMLAASMEEIGQVQLVIVWLLLDGSLQIVNGAKICAAARMLGWKAISVAILTTIMEEEVLPLMHALNSNQRRFSYRIAAKKLISTEENAKQLLKQTQAGSTDDSDLTVRQHTAKVLGFKSERHVSDLKHIINHPDCNILLEQMDQGRLRFNKAVKIAKGTIDMPQPKPKSRKGNVQVYTCPDCPRRAEFLKMLEEDGAGDTNNLDTDNDASDVIEHITPDATITTVPGNDTNTIEEEAGNE